MTPERKAELRRHTDHCLEYYSPLGRCAPDCAAEDNEEMLDEIDRLEAENARYLADNARVRTYAETMDKLHELRLMEVSALTEANAVLTEGWKPWVVK